MTTAEKATEGIDFLPFTVEATCDRNRNLLIQNIPGMILRSAISSAAPVKDARTGEEMVPVDQARGLGQMPATPGMLLKVDPRNLSYKVTDPLCDDERLQGRLSSFLRQKGAPSNTSVTGMPAQEGVLDIHQMKTLCRELANAEAKGDVTAKKNKVPTVSQCDEFDGRYLLNPGSRVRNSQPRYEDEFEEWVSRLGQQGG